MLVFDAVVEVKTIIALVSSKTVQLLQDKEVKKPKNKKFFFPKKFAIQRMLMNNGPWSPEHIYQEIAGYTTSRHRGKLVLNYNLSNVIITIPLTLLVS